MPSLTLVLLVVPQRGIQGHFRAGALVACSVIGTQDDLTVNLPQDAISAFSSPPSPPAIPFLLPLL